MSYDPHLAPATSENPYSADERTLFSSVTSRPRHDGRPARGVEARRPTSPYSGDDWMNTARNDESRSSYPRSNYSADPVFFEQNVRDTSSGGTSAADLHNSLTQAGSSADTTCGTYSLPELPSSLLEVPREAQLGTSSGHRTAGRHFQSTYTPQDGDASLAAIPDDIFNDMFDWVYDYESLALDFPFGEPKFGPHPPDDLAIIRTRSTIAPHATSLNRPSFPNRDEYGMSMLRSASTRHRHEVLVGAPSGSGGEGTKSAPDSETLYCDVPHCSRSFSGAYARGSLGRHMRLKHSGQHEGTRESKCEAGGCSKSFKRPDARLKHYRKHHPHLASESIIRRPYRGWKRKGRFAEDMNSHSNEESGHVSTLPTLSSDGLTIDDTNNAQSTLSSLASGSTTRIIHQLVECHLCSDGHKTFNRRADFRRHMATAHNPDPPRYPCTIPGCPRASHGFPRKDKLNDHMAKVHNPSTAVTSRKPTIFACPEQGCAREFDQRADLLRHQRTHTDMSERPHKCGQCDKSFLYPKDLKRHEATHLGDQDQEKPSFHCPVTSCEYGPGGSGFSRKDGMLRHMKRFHPEWKEEKEGV